MYKKLDKFTVEYVICLLYTSQGDKCVRETDRMDKKDTGKARAGFPLTETQGGCRAEAAVS